VGIIPEGGKGKEMVLPECEKEPGKSPFSAGEKKKTTREEEGKI